MIIAVVPGSGTRASGPLAPTRIFGAVPTGPVANTETYVMVTPARLHVGPEPVANGVPKLPEPETLDSKIAHPSAPCTELKMREVMLPLNWMKLLPVISFCPDGSLTKPSPCSVELSFLYARTVSGAGSPLKSKPETVTINPPGPVKVWVLTPAGRVEKSYCNAKLAAHRVTRARESSARNRGIRIGEILPYYLLTRRENSSPPIPV